MFKPNAWLWIAFIVAGLPWSEPVRAESFAECLETLKQHLITTDHVEKKSLDAVFAHIEQLPRVVAADRKQAEFIETFTAYYNKRVSPARVRKGRELLDVHRNLLSDIKDRTGIPPQYLVALWGLETNFGQYFGNLPIPSALATLACDRRRSQFFTNELSAVVNLVGQGHMQVEQLVGSWAGAMGHMQFMPTTFLAHAVDADADGRIDLYGSIADALTSGATYLVNAGWQTGFRWGREVLLPDGFDYATTGQQAPRPLKAWRQMGITDTAGNALPGLDLNAAIVLPSGWLGPAFAVYDNYNVIMHWNRSSHYALSVGRLADRIAGAGTLSRALPADEALAIAPQDLKTIQTSLNALGFNAGKPDGILGSKTRRALQQFEQHTGLVADGYPDENTLYNLKSEVPDPNRHNLQ